MACLGSEERCIQVKMNGSVNPKRATVSTAEGYVKDHNERSRQRAKEKVLHFSFTGNDAPLKTVKAIMQKYGIAKEDL
jgi:hypothetical protein